MARGPGKFNLILGDGTYDKNFYLKVPDVADGTLKLSQGDDSAILRDVLSVDSAGVVSILNGLKAKGTVTNDSAAAGYVGEYVESVIALATPVALNSTVNANMTSISLAAGDWDVDGQVSFPSNAATTIVVLVAGISTVNATLAGYETQARVPYNNVVPSSTFMFPVPRTRISLAATTTVYMVVNASFNVNTCGVSGILRARRVR